MKLVALSRELPAEGNLVGRKCYTKLRQGEITPVELASLGKPYFGSLEGEGDLYLGHTFSSEAVRAAFRKTGYVLNEGREFVLLRKT